MAKRFAGTEGACVSARVVADTAAVNAEEFPAASKAETVYEYVVLSKRPVSAYEAVADVPI